MNLALFIAAHQTARDRASAFCQSCPEGTVMEFREPKRSGEQNALLHALCGEVAKSRTWHGVTLDGEGWKRIFCEAWSRTEGKPQGRLVPSLDGRGIVALGIQTRSLSKGDMSDLIEFIHAWVADNEPVEAAA